MIVFIAGMPRAGSMWTYNVVKSCLAAAGKRVLPEEPPVNERDAILEAVSRPVAGGVYCIKTHERLPLDLPGARYICNYRDVRDAMVSYMRFMKCDFEFGLKTVKWMMDLTDYYFSAPPERRLAVPYEAVSASNTTRLIESICQFLEIDVPRKTIKQISQKYARSRIRNLVKTLNSVELDEQGRPVKKAHADQVVSAPGTKGDYRAYHKATGFQARHITSTRSREWSELLSEDDQRRLLALAGEWLVRYGFEAGSR